MKISLQGYNPTAAKALIKQTIAKRLEIAARLLVNDIKESLSVPAPPASKRGEAPHKLTGRLRASIAQSVDADALKATIGTNLAYGKFLELGTSKMPARPFLRPAVERNKDQLKQIIQGK